MRLNPALAATQQDHELIEDHVQIGHHIIADLEACVNPIGPYQATFAQQNRAPVLITASILDFVWPVLKA